MSPVQRNQMRKEVEVQCALTASAQHGVISRREAFAAGLSKSSLHRRVVSGEWVVVYPGVYRLASVPESWKQRLMAACSWLGKGAVASHRSAAALLGLDGFRPGPLELSTNRKVGRRSGLLIHQSDRWLGHDVTVVDGIPVTSPTRTLLDLGAVTDAQTVELGLEDALRKGLTSLPRLRWELRQVGGRGRRGSRILRELLDQRGPRHIPLESALEVKLLRLIRGAGLPLPVQQYEIRSGGKFVARVDFAYPEALLAIEADGYRFHSMPDVWQKDRTRHNALLGEQWRVISVTWQDIEQRPHEIVRLIRRMLAPHR